MRQQDTCGQCDHFRILDGDDGLCGKVLPKVATVVLKGEDGVEIAFSHTVRPQAQANDPSCFEFRCAERDARAPQGIITAHSLKCQVHLCGWPAVEDGLCENHLEERDREDESQDEAKTVEGSD